MAEIDEILSGKQPEKAEQEAKPEAPATEEQPRDEQGRFAPKPLSVDEVAALEKGRGQPVVAAEDPIEQRRVAEAKAQIEAKGPHLTPAGSPPTPEATPSGHIPIGAFVDMRLEAREAKRRAEAAERQLAELQKPKEEPIDPWVDPEGHARRVAQQELSSALQPLVRQIQQQQAFISRMQAERVFGEGLDDFIKQAGEGYEARNPEILALEAKMEASSNPYAVAKEWWASRNVDPAAKEAEILAKYGLGPDGKPVSNGQAGAQIMPSNLAAARNVGTRSGPAWAGPSPLKDIFSRPRK